MKKIIFVMLMLSLTVLVNAQDFTGRSSISIYAGMKDTKGDNLTVINIDGEELNTTIENSSSFFGGLNFGHFLRNNLKFNLMLRFLQADTKVYIGKKGSGDLNTENIYFGDILLGVQYYFLPMDDPSKLKPYVKGNLGMAYGRESAVTVGSAVSVKEKNETAFEVMTAAGFDFYLSNHFSLGAEAGYTMMSEFNNYIGGVKDFGGTEFGVTISYTFWFWVSALINTKVFNKRELKISVNDEYCPLFFLYVFLEQLFNRY